MDSIDDLPPPDAADITSSHDFYLYSFPDEVVMAILSFMSAPDLNNLSQCSVFSQHLANSNELWHNLFTRDKLGVQLLTRRQKVKEEEDSEEFGKWIWIKTYSDRRLWPIILRSQWRGRGRRGSCGRVCVTKEEKARAVQTLEEFAVAERHVQKRVWIVWRARAEEN